ncbi:hypothetical protein F4821DRAFT_189693 [Hypoxylon rubiginosum]|uniref:Uncharacterized protein n=1 Tax=Hypoxylon rubiginosum TaxID=110542 RepID=A0ACC0DHK2_9PEZI|nr:hypothetical protein F4821DRAFT_189693 [Hypoxylon rubiginosum]
MQNDAKSALVAFSRPLGNMEAFFPLLSESYGGSVDQEHWIIYLALKLRFPPSITDPASYLKGAWQALRLQHPALGATLSSPSTPNQGVRRRVSVVSYDPEAWANVSFSCQDEKDATALFSNLRPTATATCYWLAKSNEVVLRTSHWRIDGVGMVKLGHQFLTCLADVLRLGPDLALDVYMKRPPVNPPIGPTIEELARIGKPSNTGSEEDPIVAAAADALISEFIRGVPSIGLPTRADPQDSPPGTSSRIATTLDAATTAKITATCRKWKLKVTSVIHAALVRATAQFPQHSLSKSFAAFVPIDLRRSLTAAVSPESRNDSRVTGLYFSGLPVCIDGVLGADGKAPKDFETIARELDATYSRDLMNFWKSDESRMVSFLDISESFLQRSTALLTTPLPEGLPPAQTPDLSSLGKMDAVVQTSYAVGDDAEVEVVNCWLGTEVLNRSLQFHVWSWKGEMTLAACFNDSFYEKLFVVEILGKVIEELLAGCGIEKT